MDLDCVKVGNVYRHFKGNYYYVLLIAKDSETLENMVVYKHLNNDMICVRPEKMFLSEIDISRPDNITRQTHRFELVEELIK